jgi:hypothetical protein
MRGGVRTTARMRTALSATARPRSSLDLRNYANPDIIGRITVPGPASIAMRTKTPKVMMPSTSPPSLLINLPAIRPD